MLKLCAKGANISKLVQSVEELCAAVFTLQVDNEQLRKEVAEAKKREEKLKSELAEVRFTVGLADQWSEGLSNYIQQNNIRMYGIQERNSGNPGNAETLEECEVKVLSLFRDKLQLNIKKEDIEAVHQLGRKQQMGTPCGIIVHFVSRRKLVCPTPRSHSGKHPVKHEQHVQFVVPCFACSFMSMYCYIFCTIGEREGKLVMLLMCITML